MFRRRQGTGRRRSAQACCTGVRGNAAGRGRRRGIWGRFVSGRVRMFFKIVAVASLVVLPFSLSMWRKSHVNPEWYRCDVSPYKSLDVSVKDGLIGLHLLSMPRRSNLKSEFRAPLKHDRMPPGRALYVGSVLKGSYRSSWLVFPLWLSTSLLVTLVAVPILRGPVRRWHRKRNGRCIECAYDLRGLRSNRCPECGTTYR